MRPIGEDDLQSFIDGRLGPERQAEVEAYLAGHPDRAADLTRDREQRVALRTALQSKFDEPIPSRLRISEIRAIYWRKRLAQLRLAAAFVGIMLIGGVGGWFLRAETVAPQEIASTRGTDFARDAIAAYRTFVVEKRHPVEVAASDETHLVNWLSKRLGRQLEAPMLEAFGFHLMGGRLLPAAAGNADLAAAQFMYESEDGRRMTLYVRAGSGAETAFRYQQSGDAGTFAWVDRGFGFAVTANSDRAELLPIAEAVYQTYEGMSSGAP